MINKEVLKNTKWQVLQSTSILLAVSGLILAIYNNGFWVPLVISSLVLTIIATITAAKIVK